MLLLLVMLLARKVHAVGPPPPLPGLLAPSKSMKSPTSTPAGTVTEYDVWALELNEDVEYPTN